MLGAAELGAAQPDSLRDRLAARIAQVPGALVGVSYLDLATGRALHINGDSVLHAASTMKVPVMIEFFRQADRGERSLSDELPLVNEFRSIVDGSPYVLNEGDDSDSLVYRRLGQSMPASQLLERMIVRSSNLATNILIQSVDATKADATARLLGATNTRVLRGVEDGKAYERGLNNVTTSHDLAMLLAAIEQGRAASLRATAAMRYILTRQEFNDEIPAGLPAGTLVAHKTGFITGILHDAAIVYPQGGTPYVLVVLTGRIPDKAVARALIQDISRMVWESR